MLQIAICDDEIRELEYTYQMCEIYREHHPELDINIRKFASSYDLLEAVKTRGRYDVYLLDILMPDFNGIEIGTAIRQKDNAAILIYLTSSPDYALASYQVNAQGYLMKPLDEVVFMEVLDKAVERLDAEEKKRLLIRTAGGAESIAYSKILYIEYYKHRMFAHLVNDNVVESIVYRESFDQLSSKLMQDRRFLKISASYIVNMQHIQRVTSRSFEMVNGEILTISRMYSQARSAYLDYILESGD